jgi:uncharacterized protein involved in outer membrane biogenesis
MRLGKALKIILVVIPLIVVALVVGAIAVLMTTDFNQYKPLIAEKTKEATGRDLIIAGDLELGISLTPSVSVAGVTLSNAEWGARPEMVKVERFEAQMALIPLAFGIIDVQRIVLVGADILLEVDKQGSANFDFKAPGAKEEPAAPVERPVEAEEGGMPVPVVREVVIRDSRLTYTDAKAGASHEARIDELTINGEGPDNPIELLFNGSYNKAGIKMTASLGAPIEVIAPTKPYPVALTLEVGGANITVKGTIAEPMAGRELNLAVSVTGSQLGDLSAVAGTDVPKMGPYSMSTGVTGDPAKALNLVGFKGELAGSDVAGDVTLDLSGKRPFIDAKLKSKLIDVSALGAAAGGGAPAEGGGEQQPAKPGDRMFPDDQLPVEGLRAVDAKLTFDADTIIAAGAKLQGSHVGLSLKGGNLTIKPLKATVAEGAIDGSINLDGRKNAAGLAVKFLLSKVNLDTLLTDMRITEDIEGKGNINIDIAGTGTSVAKIMAGLNGRAGVLMGEGRMKTSFLQNMLGGTGQVLNQVLDKGKAGYTVISCAVVDFPIKKGIATAKAFYIDAEARGIIGTGTVNLRNETLDLIIDPRNKKKIDKAVLPVHITGTFLAPDYEIDKAAAASKLTGMLGIELPGALTGAQGDSEAPLIEGPCAPPAPAAAAAEPAQQPAETQPALPTTTEEAVKDVEDQVEDAVKEGLKGLFGQ